MTLVPMDRGEGKTGGTGEMEVLEMGMLHQWTSDTERHGHPKTYAMCNMQQNLVYQLY
jgi:hypothetical protein